MDQAAIVKEGASIASNNTALARCQLGVRQSENSATTEMCLSSTDILPRLMSEKRPKVHCATCQRRSYFGIKWPLDGHFCRIQAPEYHSIFLTVWEVTFETRVRSWIPPSVHTMEWGECVETGDQGGGANASISFSVFGVLFAHEHHPWSTKKLEKEFWKWLFYQGKTFGSALRPPWISLRG